jgi:hypothetical protein
MLNFPSPSSTFARYQSTSTWSAFEALYVPFGRL